MNTPRLKFYLYSVWGLIILVGVSLAIWNRNSPAALFTGATPTFPPPTASRTPRPVVTRPQMSPTITLTPIVIISTRRPVSPTPITPTTTPVTPLPTLWIQSGVVNYPPNMNPLTGLTVSDPKILDRRPVIVKVVTWPRSVRAYQFGLTHADVVYEYYIQDGETRFIAVFYGQDAEKAGPVRSGRYFDEHILRMYRGPLVFADADDRIEKIWFSSGIKFLLFLERSDNCPPLCRDLTIEGYNNLFVNTSGVGRFLTDNSRQPLRMNAFSNVFSAYQNTEISRIYTHYSSRSYNYWDYDPAHKKYLRYSDGGDAMDGKAPIYAAHIDHLTGQQVAADNVVVLVVPHDFKNEFERADQLIDINLTGSGPAYIFHSGRMIQGKWVRDLLDQPIQLMDNTNRPVPMRPGVTFYQVIDPESAIHQDGAAMYFDFAIPPREPSYTPTPIQK